MQPSSLLQLWPWDGLLGVSARGISASAAQVFVKGRVILSKAGHEGDRNPGQSYSSSSVLASGQMSSGCLEK